VYDVFGNVLVCYCVLRLGVSLANSVYGGSSVISE
jgi:hypothetical protein